MLKLLIKKQFYETFSGLTINFKTHKQKSKKSIFSTIALFSFVLIVCGTSFFAMSLELVPLIKGDYAFLYYATFGILAILLSTFVTCFYASAYLFKAKDNELLLSMPIKPKDILISRIVTIYAMCIIFVAIVWLPICINAWLNGNGYFLTVVLDILLLFIIGLFALAFACIIGYIITIISSKFKNRSFVTVLVSIIAISVYYVFVFKLENIMNDFLLNPTIAANGIKSWANIFYQLGSGANGSILNFIIFSVISLTISIIVFYVLSISFLKIAIKSERNRNTNVKVKYEKGSNFKSALFKKELKRFTSSALYMMNTALGVVFVLAAAIALIVKKQDVDLVFVALRSVNELSWIFDMLPVGIVSVVIMLIAMDTISCPSISLEGNTLWQLKVLPVNTYDIFEAKERLHVVINAIPTLIGTAIICYCLKISFSSLVMILVVILLFIDLQAWVGLWLGLLRPNFDWTNETQPIKQSLNVLYAMLFGTLYAVIVFLGCYLLRNRIDADSYLNMLVVVEVIAIILIRKWFRTKGVNKFKEL